ncbi:DinB family protein [Bacillus sp. V33-4]|uniref:DinB family protein n=1 Tax=Bacillus sp. V33-4 TaxID=2054169 RepID=UPI0035B55B39
MIEDLSNNCVPEVEEYVGNWSEDNETLKLDGFTYADVIRHVIAHEIHHIGQLSIWSRELGLKPVSANLIGRGLH